MFVVIRVDASVVIGTGHLKRCLALAHALAALGHQVEMLVRELDSVAPQLVRGVPLPVRWLNAPDGVELVADTQEVGDERSLTGHAAWAGVSWRRDAGETIETLRSRPPAWLIVDHYAFDARWHRAVRDRLGCRLLVIDDLADRPLDCDVLLDQNWDVDHDAKYLGRVPIDAARLMGPRFALLSQSYRDAKRYQFRNVVESIGIFMGGADPDNSSEAALRACRVNAEFSGGVEVATTSANPNIDRLRVACKAFERTNLLIDQTDLCAFFARHDLQIGAGGGATWERCCIGAPTILVAQAVNQRTNVRLLGERGVVEPVEQVSAATLGAAVRRLLSNPTQRESMAQRSRLLVDGCGADRVGLHLSSAAAV